MSCDHESKRKLSIPAEEDSSVDTSNSNSGLQTSSNGPKFDDLACRQNDYLALSLNLYRQTRFRETFRDEVERLFFKYYGLDRTAETLGNITKLVDALDLSGNIPHFFLGNFCDSVVRTLVTNAITRAFPSKESRPFYIRFPSVPLSFKRREQLSNHKTLQLEQKDSYICYGSQHYVYTQRTIDTVVSTIETNQKNFGVEERPPPIFLLTEQYYGMGKRRFCRRMVADAQRFGSEFLENAEYVWYICDENDTILQEPKDWEIKLVELLWALYFYGYNNSNITFEDLIVESGKNILLHVDKVGRMVRKSAKTWVALVEFLSEKARAYKNFQVYISGAGKDYHSVVDVYNNSCNNGNLCDFQHIPIMTLNASDIREILRNTLVSEETPVILEDVLIRNGKTLAEIEAFCKIVREKTGGIQRTVSMYLRDVFEADGSISLNDLDVSRYNPSIYIRPILYPAKDEHATLQQATLLMQKIFSQEPIDLASKQTTPNEVPNVAQLVRMMGFPWEGDFNAAKVIIFENLFANLQHAFENPMEREIIVLLDRLVSNRSLDFGSLLQELFIFRLQSAFETEAVVKEIVTNFFDFLFVGLTAVRYRVIKMPAVSYSCMIEHQDIFSSDDQEIHPSSIVNWCKWTLVNAGYYLVKPKLPSQSFDFAIVENFGAKKRRRLSFLQSSGSSIRASMSLVSFSLKNNATNSCFNRENLREEIAKCGAFSKTGLFRTHLLVIASTTFADDLGKHMSLDTGQSFHLDSSDDTDEWRPIAKLMERFCISKIILITLTPQKLCRLLGVDEKFHHIMQAIVDKHKTA